MYRVIVVNEKTGETVMDETTDTAIGAVHRNDQKFNSFAYCESNSLAVGGAIASVLCEIEYLMAENSDAASAFAEIRSRYLKKVMGHND